MSAFSLADTLTAVLWQIPWVAVGVALIVIAVVKRDDGLWWKLLAGAAATNRRRAPGHVHPPRQQTHV